MSRQGIYDEKYGFIPDDDCPQEKPKMTNADRIRAMSVLELATLLAEVNYGEKRSPYEWVDWLKQEAEE